MKKPSTNPGDIDKALSRLLTLLSLDDAEFPDAAWTAASSLGVDYSALCDAYDEHCANK